MSTDDPLSYRIGRGVGDALYGLGASLDPTFRQHQMDEKRRMVGDLVGGGVDAARNLVGGFQGAPKPPVPGGPAAATGTAPTPTEQFLTRDSDALVREHATAGNDLSGIFKSADPNYRGADAMTQHPSGAPAPSAPQRPPIRVVRDANGRITSASNIEGAPGEVFASNTRGNLQMDTSDEARRNYENNLYGKSRGEIAQDDADITVNRLLADDPLMRERFAMQQQYAGVDLAGRKEEARQAARYSQFDMAVDAETQQDIAEIDGVPDGTPIAPGGPVMSPALREQLRQQAINLNRQQKREIRERAFRAPASTEVDLG
jgi:hypothetical protein